MAQQSKLFQPRDTVTQHRVNTGVFTTIRNFFRNMKKRSRVNPLPHQPKEDAAGSGGLTYSVDRIPAIFQQSSEPGQHLDNKQVTDDVAPDLEPTASPSSDLQEADQHVDIAGSGDRRALVIRIPSMFDQTTEPDEFLDEDDVTGVTSSPSPALSHEDDVPLSSPVALDGRDEDLKFIIEEYFLSFTQTQLEDMEAGLYDRDVDKKLSQVCQEVYKLLMDVITNNLEQVVSLCAPQHDTCFQDCWTEAAYHNLTTQLLRQSLHITEEDIEASLQSAIANAFYGLFCSYQTIVIPDQVSHIVRSVADRINNSLSNATEASMNINSSTTCCQFSSCSTCKNLVQRFVRALNTKSLSEDTTEETLSQSHRVLGNSKVIEDAQDSKNPKGSLLWWSCYNRWRLCREQKCLEEAEEEVSDTEESPSEPQKDSEVVASLAENDNEEEDISQTRFLLQRAWWSCCCMRPSLV